MLRVALAILRVAAAVLITVLSLVVHLGSENGRHALRDVAHALLPGLAPGTARIGAVDALSPRRILISGLSWRDAAGNPVVEGASVDVSSAWRLVSAPLGHGPWPKIRVHAQRVWARNPSLGPDRVVSGEAAPAPAPPLTLELPRISLQVDRVDNALGGPATVVRDLAGDVSVRIRRDEPIVDLHLLSASISLLDLRPVRLDASARFLGERDLNGQLTLAGHPARCALRATSVGGDVTLSLRRCTFGAELLSALTRSPLPSVTIEEARIRRHRDDRIQVDGRVQIGDDRVTLGAALRGERLDLTVTPHDAALRWLGPEMPALSLAGTITASAWRAEGALHLNASTERLVATVEGAGIPGALVEAQLVGDLLRLERLSVPSLDLNARGRIDTALGAQSLELDLRAPALPLQEIRVPGLALRGSADLTASVRGSADGVRFDTSTTLTRFDAYGVRLARAAVSLRGVARSGAIPLRGRIAIDGATVAGVGPATLALELEGDPLHSAELSARAAGALPAELRNALRGNGFDAALRARTTRAGGQLRATLSAARLRVGALSLGAEARAQLSSRATGTALDRVEVNVTTPGEGRLRAVLRGRRASLHASEVSLRALAPVVPALAPIGGVVGGELEVDLDRIGRARVVLDVRDMTVPVVGRVSPRLTITPHRDGVSELNLALNAARAAGGEAMLEVRPPRRLGDLNAWMDGVVRGELRLPTLALEALDLPLPRAVRVRGALDGRVSLYRVDAQTLAVDAAVDAAECVAGVGLLRLTRDLIRPLRARVRACGRIDPRRRGGDPWSLRAAIGVAEENGSAAPAVGCGPDEVLLPMPLVDASAAIEGPWPSTLPRLNLAALRSPGPALIARLREIPIRASLALGPLQRGRWPLIRTRIPGVPASVRSILAPDVPPETTLRATLSAFGTLAAPVVEAELQGAAPALATLGLAVSSDARLRAHFAPTEGTIASPWRLALGVDARLAPEAAAASRGTIHGRAALSAPLIELIDHPRRATIDALHVEATNLRVESLATLAERGVQGGVDLALSRTDDSSNPYEARVTLRALRTIPRGLERIATVIPPVSATLRARVAGRDGGAQRVGVCLAAGPSATRADCSPQQGTVEGVDGLLQAWGEFPFPQGVFASPDLQRASVELRAQGFRVDALGALAPAATVSDLGGELSASLRWRGADAVRPVGQIELRDARATLTSLGEPLDDLNVRVGIRGRRATIERLEGRIGPGTLRVTGHAELGDEALLTAHLETQTDELPAVSNGHTWAWVSGSIGTDLTVRRTGVRVALRVHDARVRVQDEPARALIGLSPDPAVFVRGRTRLARVEAADTLPVELGFTFETPIWLRRSDFAIAINGSGTVHMDRAGTAVAAQFDSARAPSWVEFYGKRFNLDRVGVTLDGSVNINPQIDLVARHDGGAIGNVTLALAGRLYDPRISLVSESQPDLGMAEVLSLLIMGRRDSGPTSGQTDLATQAGDMARSLVTGLTLGFITSTLRAQFAFLPTLIAEPGTTDAGRYGAGFNLGPRMYLQATYGTASSAVGLGTASSSGAAEFRVLLEYAMTRALSTSLTYGTWQAFGAWQNNWGVDVFWSP